MALHVHASGTRDGEQLHPMMRDFQAVRFVLLPHVKTTPLMLWKTLQQ